MQVSKSREATKNLSEPRLTLMAAQFDIAYFSTVTAAEKKATKSLAKAKRSGNEARHQAHPIRADLGTKNFD